MERVSVDDIRAEPHPMGVNRERRVVTDAVGAEHVTAVHYELDPGEQFSGGLHTHHDQEEVFYVLDGTATFEVGTDGETVDVEAGEAIRFEPGEFQCGRNESDDRVAGLALAAPGSRHNWEDIESFAPCSECGEVTSHGVREPDEAFVVYCMECDNEVQIA
jgi:quercetin dioxygenase-like cupin family protein